MCITNGEGDVCYHLAKSFANGDILGPCIDVDLALYEHPPSGSESETQLYEVEHDDTVLDGVAMELTDLAYPLLTTVTPTACAEAAFAGCCTIVLLDEASIQSIGQSIDQSINQSINQPIRQSISQSTNQSIDRSIINQSINQIDQTINHRSIDQSIAFYVKHIILLAIIDHV